MKKARISNKSLIRKLKPFWKKYSNLRSKFLRDVQKLEKKMNKKANQGFNLEFFFCDGEAVGIGAEPYEKREKFPLIHDSDLNK